MGQEWGRGVWGHREDGFNGLSRREGEDSTMEREGDR